MIRNDPKPVLRSYISFTQAANENVIRAHSKTPEGPVRPPRLRVLGDTSVPRKRRAERSAPRSGESQCRAYFTSPSRTMPPQPRRTVTPTSLRWHVWWKLYASPVTRFHRCSWTTDHPLTELGASAEPNYLFPLLPSNR
jgi:hypothetical protein